MHLLDRARGKTFSLEAHVKVIKVTCGELIEPDATQVRADPPLDIRVVRLNGARPPSTTGEVGHPLGQQVPEGDPARRRVFGIDFGSKGLQRQLRYSPAAPLRSSDAPGSLDGTSSTRVPPHVHPKAPAAGAISVIVPVP